MDLRASERQPQKERQIYPFLLPFWGYVSAFAGTGLADNFADFHLRSSFAAPSVELTFLLGILMGNKQFTDGEITIQKEIQLDLRSQTMIVSWTPMIETIGLLCGSYVKAANGAPTGPGNPASSCSKKLMKKQDLAKLIQHLRNQADIFFSWKVRRQLRHVSQAKVILCFLALSLLSVLTERMHRECLIWIQEMNGSILDIIKRGNPRWDFTESMEHPLTTPKAVWSSLVPTELSLPKKNCERLDFKDSYDLAPVDEKFHAAIGIYHTQKEKRYRILLLVLQRDITIFPSRKYLPDRSGFPELNE
eukprot:bmy_04036T0